MKREFLINISFLVLINLLIKPFYIFGVEAKVQNIVGPEEYGIFFSLFNFCFLFQIVADLGIHSFNLRQLSQNRSLFPQLLSHLVSLKIMLGFLFLSVLAVLALLTLLAHIVAISLHSLATPYFTLPHTTSPYLPCLTLLTLFPLLVLFT